MAGALVAPLLGLCIGVLPAPLVLAKLPSSLDTPLPINLPLPFDLSRFLPKIEKKQLSTDYRPDKEGRYLKGATLQSGMALSLKNPLMNFNLDYTLRGQLKQEQGDLKHLLAGSLRSQRIDKILNMSAAVIASSQIDGDGDVYRHQLRSELRRPLHNIGNLRLSYDYDVNRRSSLLEAESRRGVSVNLDGVLDLGIKWLDGLHWNTYYNNYSNAKQGNDKQQLVEQWRVNSRYQLRNDLSLDLGGGARREFDRNAPDVQALQRRYTAGISWSPLADYALELQYHRVDQSNDQQAYFGSGNLVWTPEPLWRVELSYRDQLLPGQAGVMLSARLNRI